MPQKLASCYSSYKVVSAVPILAAVLGRKHYMRRLRKLHYRMIKSNWATFRICFFLILKIFYPFSNDRPLVGPHGLFLPPVGPQPYLIFLYKIPAFPRITPRSDHTFLVSSWSDRDFVVIVLEGEGVPHMILSWCDEGIMKRFFFSEKEFSDLVKQHKVSEF